MIKSSKKNNRDLCHYPGCHGRGLSHIEECPNATKTPRPAHCDHCRYEKESGGIYVCHQHGQCVAEVKETERHGWAIRHGATLVECPGCAFTMGIEHESEGPDHPFYDCPNCGDSGAFPDAWKGDGDQLLPEDFQIEAAHPTRSRRHSQYAEAMRLVGARHSKAGLVALVNWLLCGREEAIAKKRVGTERTSEMIRKLSAVAEAAECHINASSTTLAHGRAPTSLVVLEKTVRALRQAKATEKK